MVACRILKVQQANLETQRARLAVDSGPALYLPKLFGSDNAEPMVRLITARCSAARASPGAAS
jgi:hypothetical protein